MDSLEELRQKRVGKPWRPSNGSEFDSFYDGRCERCKHESDGRRCAIITLSMSVENTADPGYPKELTYGSDGWPTCTKFEEVT